MFSSIKKMENDFFNKIKRLRFFDANCWVGRPNKTAVNTGAVISYQSYGDMMRWNPHFHCLVLEGGIDKKGSFYHLPLKDTSQLAKAFRRRVIKLFVEKRSIAKKLCSKAPGLEAFRVFGGQFRPDSRFKPEGPGKPESVYHQAPHVFAKDFIRPFQRDGYL